MNALAESRSDTPTATPTSDSRPRGPWLLAARLGWIALTLLLLTLNGVMAPRYFAVLQSPCQPGASCLGIPLTSYDHLLLRQLHLSLAFLAGYLVVLNIVAVAIYSALGALLWRARSADRMALFGAYMLVLFGDAAFTSILQTTLAQSGTAWMVLVTGLDVLGQSAFLIFFLLFPTGRFVPRWSRWLALVIVLYWIAIALFTDQLNAHANSTNVLFFPLLLCIVATQIYRYWRVSTPRERRQTRWVVFGFAVGIIGFVLLVSLGSAIVKPALHNSQVVSILVAQTGIYGFLLLIPLSITVAILRAGLFDIDVLINRTLVYGSLTAVLALIYFGGVYGAQALLNALVPTPSVRQSPVLIVASTLLIAALFTPLRRRIQASVDRRFYRRKYDAARTLARFGSALRSEVDLSDLQTHLVSVVNETMQPTHVSLWLRSPSRAASDRGADAWHREPLQEGGRL